MSEITPEAVSERLEEDSASLYLLDIRPEESFENWHIPGSENIEIYDALKSNPRQAIDELEGLPADDEIATVCGVGEMSAVATELLLEMGYDARTLIDGLQGWGRVHRTTTIPLDDVQLFQVARPGTGCLSYVLMSDGAAIVIDPSQYIEHYVEILDEHDASLTAVLETHAHADHISGARELATEYNVPYYLHPADKGSLVDTTRIEDGDEILFGSAQVRAIQTPGHTRGSVTFHLQGEALFTGDTLFLESVGRPDLEGGDQEHLQQRASELHESVQRLTRHSDDSVVFPAHHPGSPNPPVQATLAEVQENNELVGTSKADFVREITSDVPETPPNHERIKRANVGKEELEEADARQVELGPNQCAAS